MAHTRIVVTGLGALTPLGNDVATFWTNLLAGKSGAGLITAFDASQFKSRIACELKEFDPGDYLPRRELRRIDPFCHYAVAAADEAVAHAKLDFSPESDEIDRERVGVIWATGLAGLQTMEEQVTKFVEGDGTPRFSPFYIPRILPDTSAGLLAMRYNLYGINFNTTSACASANSAIICALDAMRLGKADMMIVGGSEAAVTPSSVGGFGALTALSTRNEEPTRASRPFDANRDGFVIGEGAGALVLETYEHAQKRGAPIYAEVLGGGMSADAYHATSSHPEGAGAYRSMGAALRDAGLEADAIDYVNAHATSTPAGDMSELLALARLLGDKLPGINISGTKSMTGHLLGAAGAIESVACVKAVTDDVVPPTINLETVDPAAPAGVNLTPHEKVERPVRVAVNNSFGFGGHNATVIFGKFVP
ncbi:MAG: beta-ketoacyl-ACP synthase II [Caldilineaceae bacterium]|nr:beta-ketoacyl-ACP synthase II [Caldilineaceae bacterium]